MDSGKWISFAEFHQLLAPSVLNAQRMCDAYMRVPEGLRTPTMMRTAAVASNFLHVLCVAIDGGLISREAMLEAASDARRIEEMADINAILDGHMDCWLEMKARIPHQNDAVCPACRRAK